MKKLSILFSLLVIASMALSACGGAPATEAPAAEEPAAEAPAEATEAPATEEPAAEEPAEEISIAFWEQEGDEVDVFLDALVAEFEAANPGIKVERTHYENEALRDQFLAASLAESAPEIVRVPNDFAGPFSTAEIIVPMSDLFDDAFLGEFFPGALENAQVAGTLWGVPDNYGNHLMLIYNKSLVAEAPETFEDLIAVAEEVSTDDVYGFAYNLNEPYWGAGFYGAFGGWPLDETDAPTFDNEAFVNYLAFVKKLKDDGVVPAECNYDCADGAMKEGKAGMIINGDWSLGGYQEALGENFGVAPVPPIEGGNYTEMTGGKYYMVSNMVLEDEAKQEAVVKFITFMTSPEVQVRWLNDFKRLPSNMTVAEDESITSDPILAASMSALSNGRGQPAAASMRCAWDAWRPNLEGVMAGTTTPEDAAKAAQETADACVVTLE